MSPESISAQRVSANPSPLTALGHRGVCMCGGVEGKSNPSVHSVWVEILKGIPAHDKIDPGEFHSQDKDKQEAELCKFSAMVHPVIQRPSSLECAFRWPRLRVAQGAQQT